MRLRKERIEKYERERAEELELKRQEEEEKALEEERKRLEEFEAEKERLEALLFYFLDTIPNCWVFAVQEAMFKESLFRGLYGGDGGFHRGLVVCFCVKRQRRSKGIRTQFS